MQNSDHVKPRDNFLSRGIFRFFSTVPIKKRPLNHVWRRSPPASPLPETPSSSINASGKITENNVDGSKQCSLSLDDMHHPASNIDLAAKGQDKVLSSVTSAIHRLSSGTFQSTIEELSKLPPDGGKGSVISLVQDETYKLSPTHPLAENNNYEVMEIDAGLKVDYDAHLSIEKSNWDLNTTMGTWENEKTEFCMDECDMYQSNDGRRPSSWGDQKLMLPDLSRIDKKCHPSDSLDLQLKLSFTSEKSKLLKLNPSLTESDSIKELPTLSLSREFICTENGSSTPRAVIKPELFENCDEIPKMKIEAFTPESDNNSNVKNELIAGVSGTETNVNVSSELLNISREAKSSCHRQHSCPFKCYDNVVSQNVSECVSTDLGLISRSLKPNIHQGSNGAEDKVPSLVLGSTLSDRVTSSECENTSALDDVSQDTQPMVNEPPNDMGAKVHPLVPIFTVPEEVIACEKGEQISAPHVALKYIQTMIDDEPQDVVLRSSKLEGTDVSLAIDLNVNVNDSISANLICHVTTDVNECLNVDNVDVDPSNFSSKLADDLNLDSHRNCEEAGSSDMDISGDLVNGYKGTITVVNSSKDALSSSEEMNATCDADVCGGGNRVLPDTVTPFQALSSTSSNHDDNDSNLEYAGKADEGRDAQVGSVPTMEHGPKISNAANVAGPLECRMSCDGSGRRQLVANGKIAPNPRTKGKQPKVVRKSNKLISTGSNSVAPEIHVQEKRKASLLSASCDIPAKVGTSRRDNAAECANSKGGGAPSRVCDIKTISRNHGSPSRQMIASTTKSERVMNKRQRMDGSPPRGSRDDTCHRSSSFHKNNYEDRVSGKVSSDLMHARTREDYKTSLFEGDRTFDIERDNGKVKIGSQFHRSRDARNASRYSRRPADDELQASSRTAFREPSPQRSRHSIRDISPSYSRHSIREISPSYSRHSIRDISPSYSPRGKIPDFLPLSHDEISGRNLPDKMMDYQPLPHSLMPYEQAKGAFFSRRRSLSPPIPRRQSPPRLWSDTSPRSHMQIPPRFPRQRSPDCFVDLPEATRHRSPSVTRDDRMRSPDHFRFVDVLLRRHGSPPFVDHMQNAMDLDPSRGAMMDIIPPSGNEFPRPIGSIERSFQRFDVLSREIPDFVPSFRKRCRDIGEAEFLGKRNLDGRCGDIRSQRHERYSFHYERDVYHFDEESDQHEPSRFFRETAGKFPNRISSIDSGRHIPDHLGKMAYRPRGMEDRDDKHMHHGQEWSDVSFDDAIHRKWRF